MCSTVYATLPSGLTSPAVSATSVVPTAASVAKLTLYSTLTDNHSFVAVENLTSGNINVGHMSIPGGGTVTMGTWGNIQEHKGIWYNLEGFFPMATHVSVHNFINSSELGAMNNKVNSIDRWSVLVNCSSFATDVWNSAGGIPVSAGLINTPSGLANSIKSTFNGYQTNAPISQKTRNDFYYHTSNGVQKCPNPTGGGSSSSRSADNQYVNSFADFDFGRF